MIKAGNYLICSDARTQTEWECSSHQSLSVDPQAAEVPQEEAEETPEEDDREERERVQALIQRKKMLEDLEVVDLIQKLLQSQKKGGGGGGVPEGSEEACSQQRDQRREQAKVRPQRRRSEPQLSLDSWASVFQLDSLTLGPQRPQQLQPCPQILLKVTINYKSIYDYF